MTVAVGVVGYGVIGRRVADAVRSQPDMRLIGVAVRSPSPAVVVGSDRGIAFWWSGDPAAKIDLSAGSLEDLLECCDVIVDCGQRGTGRDRTKHYDQAGILQVYCGGEKEVQPVFSALVNYTACRGLGALRVGSCNTTGVARVVQALRQFNIDEVHLTFVRSATDPDKPNKGRTADLSIYPGSSHHAADLELLFPGIAFATHAIAAPVHTGHTYVLTAMGDELPPADVAANAIATGSRISMLQDSALCTLGEARQNSQTTATYRSDFSNVGVWAESIIRSRRALMLKALVHMEAIAIADTVDAIRAVACPELDAATSIQRTDTALRDSLIEPLSC